MVKWNKSWAGGGWEAPRLCPPATAGPGFVPFDHRGFVSRLLARKFVQHNMVCSGSSNVHKSACSVSGWRHECPLERVVVSQNEFWDTPLACFNVFFNFGVGSFSSTFGFGRFLWWKMGFQNSYFAIKVKI